jgi:dihydrodipicolinate synthase/N-acetylneuraminate lyase
MHGLHPGADASAHRECEGGRCRCGHDHPALLRRTRTRYGRCRPALGDDGLPASGDGLQQPHSTGTDLLPEHLATLADTGRLWSVKETSGEASRVRELRAELGEDVDVFVGADGIALEGFVQGASGWVAASAWLLPKACQSLWAHVRDGNWAAAVEQWNGLSAALAQIEDNPAFISLIKQALSRRNIEQGPVRPPLPTADSRGPGDPAVDDHRTREGKLI